MTKHFSLNESSKAQLLAPREKLNFYDTQSATLSREITALEAWRIISSNPAPLMKFAFRLRDRISGWFGIKPIKGFSGQLPENLRVGERLDFFMVEHLAPDILTLTARDKHLDVMTCITTDKTTLTVTSSVRTHNLLGRLYMIPVATAHRLIVRADLKRIKTQMDQNHNPLA
ncbi:hypothetical protein WH95_03590 [Kiloniella litopenaei]|uniref:DUF2867 domain-containing protein n=1 Tax=Kiloniella litopenaei TaxID=1549748 RepID=A0A0M2RET5_9PROT|nr:hypothetical protein WH95_03590 [Kiloniella litopenaei]